MLCGEGNCAIIKGMKSNIKNCFSLVVSLAALPLALNAADQTLTYTAASRFMSARTAI
jgi:hypothetical protein